MASHRKEAQSVIDKATKDLRALGFDNYLILISDSVENPTMATVRGDKTIVLSIASAIMENPETNQISKLFRDSTDLAAKGMMAKMLGTVLGEDDEDDEPCTNPDCPIHGKKKKVKSNIKDIDNDLKKFVKKFLSK